MKRSEVFTPTTKPTITYIGEHLAESKIVLNNAIEMGGVVITLSGPSKSGKTVFVETVIGKDKLIQVTGASVTSPDVLWKRVFETVGTTIPVTVSNMHSTETLDGGNFDFGLPGVFKVGASLGDKSITAQTTIHRNSPDYLNLIVKEFANTGLIIFIDDFHYIPKAIQEEISTLIKEAARLGVIFVCAAVPYHADDVILANPDLRGRMVKLDFDYWNPSTLQRIAKKGFEALNVEVEETVIEQLSMEAAGSPQLMQALCLNFCCEFNIELKGDVRVNTICEKDSTKKICFRTALMTDYSSVIVSMKEGPKSRGEGRKSYNLRDGDQLDVYPLILHAISKDPPELTIRYQNLQGRISQLCRQGDTPSGSSVTGACTHLMDIANLKANSAILEWDAQSDVLYILDPYLLFALRWSDWSVG